MPRPHLGGGDPLGNVDPPPPESGAGDANWVLDDPSDAGALAFLREVAQMLREVIAAAPPTAERWSEWPPAGL